MVDSKDASHDQGSPVRTPSESEESESRLTEPLDKKHSSPQPRPHGFLSSLQHDPEDTNDDRFKNVTYESVESYPLGYPSWAAVQNSDPTFRVYKRFGTLRNRVILYRQLELARLEEKLNELDKDDHQKHNHRIRSLRKDTEDKESKRMELIDQIDTKLKHYDDLLERELRSGLMQKPTKRNYRTLVNYLWNYAPIVRSEMNFLRHRDDFVLLTGQSESPLERTLDKLVCKVPIAWFRRLFSSEAQRDKIDKTTGEYIVLTSTEKVERLARVIASLLAVLLIGVPLFVLASTAFCDKVKVAVLLVALVLFPAAIQVAARPKNHDLFTSTAAYCAVLSTFLATSANLNNLGQSQMQIPGNTTIYH
ncbi:uncharacterized protein BDR25DRAFT_300915 [Lindgomyces ingoldianus]|uniref:Uncharacterized protein n=1 Tax=Lindgomyces ingoldianus TaxID=673940 RepID=A0ACB6RC76_9PLEO|nr:uncharacterized protein BDR25DRAFT_300915 [Lindgomyces ingoldianus]KAF2476127.1 hypothetical protein BDR25DRAFT_300915 [Lindgomyces ingoldianus]